MSRYITLVFNFIVALEVLVFWLPNVMGQSNENPLTNALYVKLFQSRRIEQLDAVKSLQKIKNYDQKYKMVSIAAENIFSVIQTSRARLEASGFIPGVSDFPTKDALSSILENTALFSEIVLRLPDISASVLKINNNWHVLLQWGLAFTTQMHYLLDKNTMQLFRLVSQELNHISRSPNFVNPYRNSKTPNSPDQHHVASNQAKKKKKVIRKGPRIHNDL